MRRRMLEYVIGHPRRMLQLKKPVKLAAPVAANQPVRY